MLRIFLLIHVFFGVFVVVPPSPVEISANNFTICTPISQEVNGKLLWWGNYTTEGDDNLKWYISEPLCLSENYTIVKRSCTNGTWSEELGCTTVQSSFSPCPENFTYNEEKEICYVILSNQTFPPVCPYKNIVSFYDYAQLVGEEIEAPVWFPATRLGDYGVGAMSMVEPTRYYGSILSVSYNWKNSINKNCLISYSSQFFESAYCNSTYDAVCAYKPLGYIENTYCKTVDDRCYYSDYDLEASKCFCLQSNVEDCQTLAEFKKPYQNFIITSNRNECRIALGIEGNLLWTNSKEEISYSNWDRKTDFNNIFGVLTEDSSWSLRDDNLTDCWICEESTTFDGANMSFTMDTHKMQLILLVDNPEELYIPEGSNSPLFCFTDTANSSGSVQYSPITFDSFEVVNNTKVQYYFNYSSKFPGHYWCQAFMYPSLDIIKTDMLFVFDEDIYGNEFATTFVVKYNSSIDPRTSSFCQEIHDMINENISEENETLSFYMRFLTITAIDEVEFTIEYLIHVTSKRFRDIESEHESLNALIASGVSNVGAILYMTDFRSVSYCLPNTTVSNGVILQWPLTKINTTVTPEEFCLQEDGLPVMRTCTGDFLTGARWNDVKGSCADNPVQSSLTAKLYELVHTNASLNSKSDSLAEMTQGVAEYIPVDIHYIAEILDKSDKEDVNSIENVTTVIDNIIYSDHKAMRLSQNMLNSTDRILYNFDLLLQNFIKRDSRKASDTIVEIITRNLMVFVFDAKMTDVTGIAIFNNSTNCSEREFVKLRRNVSYADLTQYDDLEMAAYIPEILLEQITKNLNDEQPLIVIITVFLNDFLFNEQRRFPYGNPYRNVLGILLPNIDEEYEASVQIFYNLTDTKGKEEYCAYWHYGSSDFENIKGEWKYQKEPLTVDSARVCNFEHTTHFALLVVADISDEVLESYAKHSTILHVITSIGCALSIMGIFCIYVTATVFTRWRHNKGNQIVMHYSTVTLLQISLLYISEAVRKYGDSMNGFCVFVGVSLHYIVLAQFCWMLVMGVLHYQRFVLVFVKPNQRIMLKACIVGYVLPMIPIIINLSTLSPSNYTLGNTGMCYPTGSGFIFYLLVPVLAIASLNLILFSIIIWNIFIGKIDDVYKHDYVLVLKLRLVAVLFSLLGITWLFGFAAEFFEAVVFAYLFTMTGSVQGFIIFLAFVIFNDSTRNMYYILVMKSYKYRKW